MKPRVLIILPNLRGGGTERTVVNLLRNFDYHKVDVRLLLVSKEGPLVNGINPELLVFPTQNLSGKSIFVQVISFLLKVMPFHIRYLKRYKPNVIMTCTEWMNDYGLILCRFRPKKAIWVTRSGQNTLANSGSKALVAPLLNGLTQLAHRSANAVIVPCHGLRNQFIHRFNVSAHNVFSIFNPLEIDAIREKSRHSEPIPNQPYIIAIGRLERQKRFDLLIKAFHESALPRQSYQLLILGVGSQAKTLRDQVSHLKLGENVVFKGFVNNPYPYLAHARAFVLTSDWEGFAHVVAEALVCETPVIASNCPFGPEEILEGGRHGVLFEPGNREALVSRLNQVASYEQIEHDSNISRFGAQEIAQQYLNTFNQLAI